MREVTLIEPGTLIISDGQVGLYIMSRTFDDELAATISAKSAHHELYVNGKIIKQSRFTLLTSQ